MNNPPCKNCQKREPGCHSKCAEYCAFKVFSVPAKKQHIVEILQRTRYYDSVCKTKKRLGMK